MMTVNRVLINTILLVSLLSGMIPLTEVEAQTVLKHSFDDTALLMISSKIRLDDVYESATITGGSQMSITPRIPVDAELRILIQMYQDQIARLRASNQYSEELEQKLVNELEAKVLALHAKAQQIAQKQNRRRGGLLGIVNRGFNWLGRASGKLVGGLMEGAGEVASFAIEEVAPQVLQQWIKRGVPLNAELVRRVVKDLLWEKLEPAIIRWVDARKRRIRVENEDSTVNATDVADLLEAFGEDDQSTSTENGGDDQGSDDAHLQVSFTGQASYVCDMFVGEGGDSDMMGRIPLDVNFTARDFLGEAFFSYENERGQTLTTTLEYQGSVSEEGILIGTETINQTVDNADVGYISIQNIAMGITTEDGSGLFLYTSPDPEPELLQAFTDGRDAVLSKYSDWWFGNMDNPPNCR